MLSNQAGDRAGAVVRETEEEVAVVGCLAEGLLAPGAALVHSLGLAPEMRPAE